VQPARRCAYLASFPSAYAKKNGHKKAQETQEIEIEIRTFCEFCAFLWLFPLGGIRRDVSPAMTVQVEALADFGSEWVVRPEPQCSRRSILRAVELAGRGVSGGEHIEAARVASSC